MHWLNDGCPKPLLCLYLRKSPTLPQTMFLSQRPHLCLLPTVPASLDLCLGSATAQAMSVVPGLIPSAGGSCPSEGRCG